MQVVEIGFFKGGIKTIKQTNTVSVERAFSLISGDTYKEYILKLRSANNESIKKVQKSYLDYFTFSGTFSPSRKVENLKKHSGLLVLDFDKVEHLAELAQKLYADVYTHLGFISPSGNGIKIVVKINPKQHLESFISLSSYYKEFYGLEVDASGKDVCRPCYVSHDPDAVFKADSKLFVVGAGVSVITVVEPVETVETPVATGTTASLNVSTSSTTSGKTTPNEKHIALVVSRIVSAQIDITGNYSDEWLLIGFCMATLGESGRKYFHAISKFNEAYNEDFTDEKYNDFLKNGKFKTPGKFFSICKDYGVDVRKTVSGVSTGSTTETTKTTEPTETVAEKFRHKVRYYEGGMSILGTKNWIRVADGFQIFVKNFTEDEYEEITWVLELKTPKDSFYIEIPHKDFYSAAALKAAIGKKRLSLKITDAYLSDLQEYLFAQDFSKAKKIGRFGLDAETEVYFFSNGVLHQGKRYKPDEFGIVNIGKICLSMPNLNKKKQHRFTLTETQLTFNQWWVLYSQAHLYQNAIIPAAFYLFCLFRDIALVHKKQSPILYLKGQAGTGKSSVVRNLTCLFGFEQEEINLKSSNTDKALVKLLSQIANGLNWFDEFYNGFAHEGLLQASYDNAGYHKSTDTNSIETDNIEIKSALALTSNYQPENPIFFSRTIYIPINSQQKTNDQRINYQKLTKIEEAGLSCVTVEMLQHRELVRKYYGKAYEQLYDALKDIPEANTMPERLFTNMAQVLTPAFILQRYSMIALNEFTEEVDILQEFRLIGQEAITRQHRIGQEKTALSEFFEMLQTLYDQNQIHEGSHFRFEMFDNHERINLRFSSIYTMFKQRYYTVYRREAPSKDSIEAEISKIDDGINSDDRFFAMRFRVEEASDYKGTTIPVKGSCTILYSKLVDMFELDLQSKK